MAGLVNLLASIITIVNFVYAAIQYFSDGDGSIPQIPFDSISLSIIMLILLEASLAAVFGWLIVALVETRHAFTYILAFVVAYISAWLSLFNCEWLLLGEMYKGMQWAGILLCLGALCMAIAIMFINEHANSASEKDDATNIQLGGFTVCFFIFVYAIWSS
ncbi:hypothetical protein [Alteromonas macleodii]|uniref:hypothetical protein n=1 Tax=Alteromonas macleodii TaxID=28108 RepID=UPI0012D34BF8|nr:hypothetical protein [Alteromonas macleodii]